MGGLRARALINGVFDAVVRIGPDGCRSGFRACGAVGFALGLGWTLLLAQLRGQSAAVTVASVIAAVGSFLALVVVRTRRTGMARLICFRDQAAALGGATALLLLLRQPVLVYLDIVALGLGILIAGGRVGCLLVGCCHGRPSTWGPRYGPAHVREGFPAEYAGVRLLPVSLFEAAALVGVVVAGSAIALRGEAPGSVLASYVIVHVFVRFWLEFLRGDERPVGRAVSEAQWTAVAVTACLAAMASATGSATIWWLAAASLAIMLPAVIVAARASGGGLGSPRHVREMLGVVRAAERAPGEVVIVTTQLGIQISAQVHGHQDRHYAFSRACSDPATSLTWSEATTLGRVAWLAGPIGPAIMAGPSNDGPSSDAISTGFGIGVYHLSVRPAGLLSAERAP